MGIEHTNRADDPRLAAYRGLRDGDLLRSRGLFVAEGRLVVRRVLADSRYRVQSVLVNDAALRDLEQAMTALDATVPIFVCTADRLADIAGYEVHRGCLALVHRPPPETIDAVTAASTTLVVLEGVSNADNVGGVFRNAAAFGGRCRWESVRSTTLAMLDEQSRCRVGPKNLFDHPARDPHPLVHQISPVGWPRGGDYGCGRRGRIFPSAWAGRC